MRLVFCDNCGRKARKRPAGSIWRKTRGGPEEKYEPAPKGEWTIVIADVEGTSAKLGLDACCVGCAEELRATRWQI